MPSKSRAQARLMRGVCSGSIKRKGFSKKTACHWAAEDAKKARKRKKRR